MKYLGYLLIFLMVIFNSCYIKKNMEGVYTEINKGKKYLAYGLFIKLNKDSTFSYMYGGGPRKNVSEGTWQMRSHQRELILTSYISDTDHLPIIIEEKREDSTDYNSFILTNPLKTVEWTLISEGKRYVFESDTLKLPVSTSVDSFYISGYKDYTNVYPYALQERINSTVYKIKDKGNNVFSIDFPSYVDYDIFHFLPLQDTIKIRRNTLIWKRKGYWNEYTLKLKKVRSRSKRK